MRSARAEPCIFIMFGATGDLMRRKLLPALYNLAEEKLLPPGFQILGVARDAKLTEAQFRKLGRSVLADAGFTGNGKIASWCNACSSLRFGSGWLAIYFLISSCMFIK